MTNNILHKDYTLNRHNYQLSIPLDIEVCIPSNDCVRLISQFVEEMDLSALYESYDRIPASNHVTPKIMLKILLYAYHEGLEISSRRIEKNCKRDVNYMYLLEGRKAPDHATIARFRTKHLVNCAEKLMLQMTEFLYRNGQITDTEVFIDGTKIEANANRYTFVWKKAVTKHQARLLQKTALLVEDIINYYGMKPIRNKEVKKKHVKALYKRLLRMAKEQDLEFKSGRGHRKARLQKDIEDLKACIDKIKEYEEKLHKCGNRNSYSKTDNDATFMHLKDDYFKNGQLKPAYNVQHAVNSGYIVMTGIFPNPADALTLKPFLEQLKSTLPFKFKRIVADAGYESEENLVYLENEGMEAYIKPANYEQLGTKKFLKQIGKKENMKYDAENDQYICHAGNVLTKQGVRSRKTASGYVRIETEYLCKDCHGCPYGKECLAGKNWKLPLEERKKRLTVSRTFERLRKKEYDIIDTETGKELRMNRSIQVEGSFADIKGDSKFTRFMLRGNANVKVESILFAMAHNLGWLHSRIQNGKLDIHLYELKDVG